MLREGLTGKVSFEQRPEGSRGPTPDIWEKVFPGREEEKKSQGPEAGACLVCSRINKVELSLKQSGQEEE